jgi:Zn-dependent protease with chaperone function
MTRTGAPRYSRRMYLMVLLALIGSGLGAGQAVGFALSTDRAFDLHSCLTDHGLRLTDVAGRASTDTLSQYHACVAGYNRAQIGYLLGGAVIVPALALLLAVGSGLWLRARLRRIPAPSIDPGALTTSFERWCDEAELVGRRRPRLQVVPAGRGFTGTRTTAVPFSRPVVVLPAGYLLPGSEPAATLALAHELGHVRSRDLVLAAATSWAGWLNLPVLIVALIPGAFGPTPLLPAYVWSIILAITLSATVFALRASVLRRRESQADRYALQQPAVQQAGGEHLLRAAAGQRQPPPQPGWQRLFRTHPDPGERVDIAARAEPPWQDGFTFAWITSLLATFTFQAFFVVTISLGGFTWWRPNAGTDFTLALAGPAVFWAAVLVPAWAASDRPMLGGRVVGERSPARWPVLFGSAVGLTLGIYIPAPSGTVSLGSELPSPPVSMFWLVLAGLGISVIAGGFADAARGWTGRRSHWVAVLAAVTASAAALITGWNVAWNALVLHWLNGSEAFDRAFLIGQGAIGWWRWTLPLILAIAVGLSGSLGDLRKLWRPIVGAAVVGAGVALVLTQMRIGTTQTGDEVWLLLTQRWWICALAGWVVLVSTLLTAPAGTRGLPAFCRGLVAGTATAVLAGLAQFARDLLAGESVDNLRNLVGFVRGPGWLLGVLVVVTVPAVLAVRDFAGPADPDRRWVPGTARLSAAVVVVTLPVALTLTGPLTGVRADQSTLQRLAAARLPQPAKPRPAVTQTQPTPQATEQSTGPALDPDRQLRAAQADAILRRSLTRLPHDWRPLEAPKIGPSTSHPATEVRPAACDDLLKRLSAADTARPRSADRVWSAKLHHDGLPLGTTILDVTLTSYRSAAVATETLADSAAQPAKCSKWSTYNATATDHRMNFTLETEPAQRVDGQSWQAVLRAEGRFKLPMNIIAVLYFRVIGRNVVVVSVTQARRQEIDLKQLRLLRDDVMTATVAGLK